MCRNGRGGAVPRLPGAARARPPGAPGVLQRALRGAADAAELAEGPGGGALGRRARGARAGAAGLPTLALEAFEFCTGDDVEMAQALSVEMVGLDMAPEDRARDAQLAGGLGQQHHVLHVRNDREWGTPITGYHDSQLGDERAIL